MGGCRVPQRLASALGKIISEIKLSQSFLFSEPISTCGSGRGGDGRGDSHSQRGGSAGMVCGDDEVCGDDGVCDGGEVCDGDEVCGGDAVCGGDDEVCGSDPAFHQTIHQSQAKVHPFRLSLLVTSCLWS